MINIWDVGENGWTSWAKNVDRPSTAEIAEQGIKGTLFVNEILDVRAGTALEYLSAVVEQRVPMMADRDTTCGRCDEGRADDGITECETRSAQYTVGGATLSRGTAGVPGGRRAGTGCAAVR